jgi:pyruvate-formate lyase-activating enzyme
MNDSPRNVTGFRQAQKLGAHRLGFSVTQACPLRCAHCSVEAHPSLGHTTLDDAFADRVAAQMPELAAADIRFVDFTGGEPTLATRFVTRVGRSAQAAGMSTGIVTAAHWATSASAADAWIHRFDCIANWDISTDVHHTPYVSLERVELAFERLERAGRSPLIRIAHSAEMTRADAELIRAVQEFAGDRIAFQPVGPVGRARDFVSHAQLDEELGDPTPCPSTGPLVQLRGRVAPCCAPVSHERSEHPLIIGDASCEPLVQLVHRWRVHPLLQAMRLWGTPVLHKWLGEAGFDTSALRRERGCTSCVELIRRTELVEAAMRIASTTSNRIRIAHGLQTTFSENWLADELRREARALLEVSS